ncbi:MAG: hypothetical protein JXC32_15780 [Anaerolineae bacterium]|nr:hypothetical protein [Anaerolineae bacterium]
MKRIDLSGDHIPIWCDQCDQQGFIFVKDVTQPVFVVCAKCGSETSEVWCPRCAIGGEYVADLKSRSLSWKCPGCGTEYPLPQSFYERPVPLQLTDDLPGGVRARLGVRRVPSEREFIAVVSMPVTILALAVALWAALMAVTEVWPGPDLETRGMVIGHGCADRTRQPGEECHSTYSIIHFVDSNGQTHQIHRPGELSGLVLVRYRYINLPLIGNVGITTEGSEPRWLGGMIFGVFALSMVAIAVLGVMCCRGKLPLRGRRMRR